MITLVYGLPGRSKTHFSTYYVLALAEKYRKKLVLNYQLHPDNLISYCRDMGYKWLLSSMSSEKTIFYCDMEQDREQFLTIPDTICVCDESSGYFPARGSGSIGVKQSQFLKDLTQVRHRRQYVLFIAQSQEQIDLSIKILAEEIIQCNGISLYDSSLGSQRLVFRIVRRFSPDKFASWASNPRLRANPLKTHLMANKNWLNFLFVRDAKLFDVYSSFALVHAGGLTFPDSSIQYVYPSRPTLPSDISEASSKSSKNSYLYNKKTVRKVDLSSLDNDAVIQADMSYDYFPFIPVVALSFVSSPIRRFLFTYLPADVIPIWSKIKTKFLSRFIFFKYPYISLASRHRIYFSFDLLSMYHRFCICLVISIVFALGLNLISFLAFIF